MAVADDRLIQLSERLAQTESHLSKIRGTIYELNQKLENASGKKRHLNILLIEDDPEDVMLAKDALISQGVGGSVMVFEDSDEALHFLECEMRLYSTAATLILLDLRLTRSSGFEFLRVLRSIPNLKRVPVVVLTGSHEESDVNRAYELGANLYVTKPTGMEAFSELLGRICRLFEGDVNLPTLA